MTTFTSTVPFQATDEKRFREVMGYFASGVVAVTGMDAEGGPLGLTVTSFTSVSLAPPLVSFCVAHTSRTWPRLRASRGICINILSEDQQDLSTRLARSGERKFSGLGWSESPNRLPVLDAALAWLEGTVATEHPAGDHDIIVIRVDRMATGERCGPLLSYRGAYGRLADR
ncbi:MAG: flavin reductase family protein [Streptomycetaceae bacterium]|nr:flavin reductase family protein [Streptomycetaceae bacterium]